MIKGIGTDIIELDRVRRILADGAGDRFLRRILTERELARLAAFSPSSPRRIEFAAGRFAAKEAVSKALGCGIGEYVGFLDMEIVPDRHGRPECRLSPQAREKLGLAGEAVIHVTISHSHASAVAFAVWEEL